MRLSQTLTTAAAILLSLAFTLPSADAQRTSCADVTVRNSTTVDDQQLVLNGMGIREATVFNVDVYVAALYLMAANSDGNAILQANETKRIDLHIVRDIEREDMQEAVTDSFGNNGLANQVGRFANMLPEEITEGMVLSFIHRPGQGLEVRVNNRRRGQMNGDRFATAFFRIFIGANPPNRGLKRGLLGGECD